jgi:type IV pilus assembly protein PilY1
MKPSIKIRGRKYAWSMIMLAVGACLTLLAGDYRAADAASCIDLADVPLESVEKPAPGMIMFVLDDSGSMDWSMMCPPPESNGVFNGNYYIFENPGDDLYGYDNLEDIAGERMMWMSQWSGYNGMYYDPETEYTPWPTLANADPDNPRSYPTNATHTLDMTAMWHEWDSVGVVIDNTDAGYSENIGIPTPGTWTTWATGWNGSSRENLGAGTVSAQWEASAATGSPLNPSILYDVQVRWPAWGGYTANPQYEVYDGGFLLATSAPMNQAINSNTWMTIATDVSFSTGIGIVKIPDTIVTADWQINADAVQFVPKTTLINDVARRHYFVQNASGTYLVNLLNGVIEYYRVNLTDPTDNREVVTADKLLRLTGVQAAAAGIITGRSYAEEIQNFANWYSFYRRRELTAKNAIANVINSMDGVYIGLIYINNYRTPGDQQVVPVRVNVDGTFLDESATLLANLYSYQYGGYGTPLRNGLKKAGRFFQGDYLKPGTFTDQTNTSSFPFFKADKGGTCQQAFTIIFSDGYYNGSSPSVGNTDGDNNTAFDGSPFGDGTGDTLADVAMYYYETDLNGTLDDDVSSSTVDPANHQHMVTYTLAFGVTGSLDTQLFKECPAGACPGSWPATSSDSGKIDDMFHAAINGRGAYLSAGSTAELNAALTSLSRDIESRLGASSALATNSIQLSVGSVIYQGTYNTANWYGEVTALPLNVSTGHVGTPIWQASSQMPQWDQRTILSYSDGAGIVFEEGFLSAGQKTALEASAPTGSTAADIVNFIRGDTSNSVANGGILRNRNHPIGDIAHSAPTYFDNTVYIGANDGMLHAFNSADGVELFAYVPNLVYDHLGELSDPAYSHRFFVDNTAKVAKVGSQNILVGGLGKGGKGYFALDVTHPDSMVPGDVLWEFSDANDMGYSYSKAIVVKTKAAGHVVIFGNGYDSVDGKAVLFVLNPADGTVLKKFDTGVGGCNGLSTPGAVDIELDGYTDFVYAGDLKGNVWKFDLRGSDTANWKSFYQNGIDPHAADSSQKCQWRGPTHHRTAFGHAGLCGVEGGPRINDRFRDRQIFERQRFYRYRRAVFLWRLGLGRDLGGDRWV